MVKLNKEFKPEYGFYIYGLAVALLIAGQLVAGLILEAARPALANGGTIIAYVDDEPVYKGEYILKYALSFIFQITNFAAFFIFVIKSKAKPDLFFAIKDTKTESESTNILQNDIKNNTQDKFEMGVKSEQKSVKLSQSGISSDTRNKYEGSTETKNKKGALSQDKGSEPSKTWVYCILGVILGLVCLFCFMCLAEAGQRLLKSMGYKLTEEYVQGIPAQDILLVFLSVLAAPVCEELVYRSGLLSGLKKSKQNGQKKQLNNIIISALCGIAFAFMHMNPEQTIYQFCLGFGAAMLTLNCGSVLPAMLMHSVSNLAVALSMISTKGVGGFFDWYEKVFVNSSTAIFAVSAALLALTGFAVFVFIPPLVKKMADKKAEGLNAESNILSKYNGKQQLIKQGFFGKHHLVAVYLLVLVVSVFMWVSVFIAGI